MNLPTELLVYIFELVRIHAQSYVARCALVCRGWRDSAQYALVCSTSVRDQKHALAWFNSEARERHVTMHLTLGYGVDEKLGLRIIAECPSLVSLDAQFNLAEGYAWASKAPSELRVPLTAET